MPTIIRRLRRELGRCRARAETLTSPAPPALRLRNAADVLALLEEQVGAVRAEPGIGVLEKARAVGYLAGVALKAVEARNLAARVEALEAILKQRAGGGQP